MNIAGVDELVILAGIVVFAVTEKSDIALLPSGSWHLDDTKKRRRDRERDNMEVAQAQTDKTCKD